MKNSLASTEGDGSAVSETRAAAIVPVWSAWSREAYEAACFEHEVEIAADLLRIDARIERAAEGAVDPKERARLETMRAVLESGLFDADYYLKKYDDVRMAEVDPLEHYVQHGDGEGRTPNPAFLPRYYRRHHMSDAPPQANALAHYIEIGERSGAGPNAAFEPLAYLRETGLADFVTRPLFHYLKIGRAAGYRVRGVPFPLILAALEYRERVQAGGTEDHLLLMEAKRAAVDVLGVQGGFAAYKDLIGRPDHAEIRPKRLAGLAEYCREHAAVFRETAPRGERVVVPPPPVIGDGGRPPLDGRTRSMFVACLVDAQVRSRSNVIEVDDAALLDYEGEELARIEDQLDYDPAVFHRAGEAVWLAAPSEDRDVIEVEEAFSLLGIYSHAFGHWMIEFLPKYVAASLTGALPRVPVLIDRDVPATFRQALEPVLADGVGIIELPPFSTARVRRLWCAPTQGHFPVCQTYSEPFRWDYFVTPPSRFVPVVREIKRRLDRATAEPTGVERVYLAREPHQHNKLVNHPAIEAAAEARGFRVVFAHRLDFVEQARLLRHARFVIGPDGSQMFLAIFARPGTRICLLSNDQPDNVGEIQAEQAGLYGECGLNYTVVTGPIVRLRLEYPWQSNYRIDEKNFCRFLDQWLDAGPGDTPAAPGGSEGADGPATGPVGARRDVQAPGRAAAPRALAERLGRGDFGRLPQRQARPDFRPLIYTMVYGPSHYYAQLGLFLNSLIEFGEYDGDVAIMCDSFADAARYIPENHEEKISLLHLDDCSMMGKYSIIRQKDFRTYSPLIYFDTDIIVDRPIGPRIAEIFAEDRVCVTREIELHRTIASRRLADIEIRELGEAAGWFGLELLTRDMLCLQQWPLLANAGIIGFRNHDNFKLVFNIVKRIYTNPTYADLRRYTDQPFLNYVLVKTDLGGYGPLEGACTFVEDDTRPEERRGFAHFIGLHRGADKLDAMEGYLRYLRTGS